MPKTRLQELFFSIMMSFMMTYGMELYNLSLLNGGLTEHLFIDVFQDVFLMMIVVFCVERYIGGKLAKKMVNQFMDFKEDKPMFITLAIQCCTVLVMSPTMSLIATIIFKNPGTHIISVWIQTIVFNFPFAFFLQIFFVGPFVRTVFKFIFEKRNNLTLKY
ncbi:MAG: DUF2798 domain-containing protein [Coprobacillus sp.]